MTEFQEIYDEFLSITNDYDFAKIEEKDLEFILSKYLKSAVGVVNMRLGKKVKDFEMNKEEGKFVNDIQDVGIKLVAQFMVEQYLKSALYTTELVKQTLSDKDYKMFSQANHINQLKDLYNNTRSENNSLLTSYSYLRMVGEDE